MKRIQYIQVAFGLLLGVALIQCDMPEVEGTDYLTVSEYGQVDMPAVKTNKELKVTCNNPVWEVVKMDADWLKVEKTPTSIRLSADANPETTERKCEILVVSGTVSQKIVVTQAGADNSFHLSQDHINFAWWDNEVVINLSVNSPEWEASTTADWIELTVIKPAGQLRVNAEINPTNEARQGHINLSTDNGRKQQQIVVHQEGQVLYFLPSFDFMSHSMSVRMFEFGRFSELLAAPDGVFNKTTWTFGTDSKAFNRITYTIFDDTPNMKNSKEQYYKYSEVIATDPTLFETKRERDAAGKFLSENGFVFNEEAGAYTNYDLYASAEVRYISSETSTKSSIFFYCTPFQPEAYRTIGTLPSVHKEVQTLAEVKAYEEAHQGLYVPERSFIGAANKTTDGYYYSDPLGNGKDAPLARYYDVKRSTGEVNFICYYYDTKSLGLFEYKGSDFLTEEIVAKMKELGYKYVNETQHRTFKFYSEEGYAAFVRWVNYAQFTEPLLEILVQPSK